MKGLAIFDVDDTLIKTNSKIYKTYNGKITTLSSEEFAKDNDKGKEGVKYDFKDFSDPESIKQGILKGKPIIKNLKILDYYANKGYEIAFLTARNNEEIIYQSLFKFLKIRNKNGKLEPILNQLSRELSVAIEDPKYNGMFHSTKHYDKKAEVLDDYCDAFDEVIFIDDDLNNLSAAKNLDRDNLTTIQA